MKFLEEQICNREINIWFLYLLKQLVSSKIQIVKCKNLHFSSIFLFRFYYNAARKSLNDANVMLLDFVSGSHSHDNEEQTNNNTHTKIHRTSNNHC